MEPITANIRLRDGDHKADTEATQVGFSAHQCFQLDGGPEERHCFELLARHLVERKCGLALYGLGRFLDTLLAVSPDLKPLVRAIVCDGDVDAAANTHGLPVVPPDRLPDSVKVVFLCETMTVPRLRMRKRVGSRAEVLCPDVLPTLDWRLLPQRAWVPRYHSIYPIDLPDIEFESELDLLLLDCPARNLAMLPNGLAYVHNALKLTSIKFQTFDLDPIVYHRYHMERLFDWPGRITTPGGHIMHEDPWVVEGYEEWQKPETLQHFRRDIDEIVTRIVRARPKILGLSVQSCNIRFCREVALRVKAALPETLILAGGYSCYQSSVRRRVFEEADYMCIGEADLTVGPLVEALARGERPKDLKGVASRFDTPDRVWVDGAKPMDLGKLEMVKYEFSDLSLYRNWDNTKMAPVIASRGCRWSQCTFCAERFLWRVRDPREVVDEFEYLLGHGFDSFCFNESDLNGKPEILVAVCDEFVRRGLKVKLSGQLRIHKNSDRAFFDKLAAAGFVALRFGVDAWSANTLKLQKKGYNKARIKQNLKDCFEAGINVDVNTVIGVPGETDADVDETIEYMLECGPYICTHANINQLLLVIGSVYWEQPEKLGVIFRGDRDEIFAKYPTIIPDHLWYSADPYIDEHVRKERFKKIVRALYKNGCRIGRFAERVIADVEADKGAGLSARPAEFTTITCEQEGAPTVASESAVPAPEQPPLRVIRYQDDFFSIPLEEGVVLQGEVTVRKGNPVISMARTAMHFGLSIAKDRYTLTMAGRACMRIARAEGIGGVFRFIGRRLKSLVRDDLIVVMKKPERAAVVPTISGPEKLPVPARDGD